jgi:flagellar hook-basal body complex protein FliE
MAAPIAQIAGIPLSQAPTLVRPLQTSEPGLFQSVLNDSIDAVQNAQTTANQGIGRFLSGEGEELHHVALATQQAELSFELFMQVRNKVVSAYQDLMRMQI